MNMIASKAWLKIQRNTTDFRQYIKQVIENFNQVVD